MTSILLRSAIRERSASRRVLIVDDHVDSADMAAELLSQCGHETRVAYNPLLAISIATSFRPQIALLDIQLPNMDGYELANLLRADPALAECRFIALTANAFEVDYRRTQAAGFCYHLVKPFGAQALFDAVASEDSASGCAPAAGWSVG
jgi:CheY-like chemotaxis protein